MTVDLPLTASHRRRLRQMWRSAGWPFQDLIEVELLAAGLLERVRDGAGREVLRVTEAWVTPHASDWRMSPLDWQLSVRFRGRMSAVADTGPWPAPRSAVRCTLKLAPRWRIGAWAAAKVNRLMAIHEERLLPLASNWAFRPKPVRQAAQFDARQQTSDVRRSCCASPPRPERPFHSYQMARNSATDRMCLDCRRPALGNVAFTGRCSSTA